MFASGGGACANHKFPHIQSNKNKKSCASLKLHHPPQTYVSDVQTLSLVVSDTDLLSL